MTGTPGPTSPSRQGTPGRPLSHRGPHAARERRAKAEEEKAKAELLDHLRQRCADFQEERAQLIEKVEQCFVEQDEVHKLEWQLKQRTQEVRELQQALSNSHLYLFEERERLLVLQSQNDSLRLQELEDRNRIHHLLALTQPVEEGIEYSLNEPPQKYVVYPPEGKENRAGPAAPGGKNKVKTVYLPNATADNLLLHLEALQARAKAQSELANAHIAALLEDRQLKEQENARDRENFEKEVQRLTQRLHNTEKSLQTLTKDYISAQKEKEQAEVVAEEAKVEAAEEKAKVAKEFRTYKKEVQREYEKKQEEQKLKTSEYVQTFRKEISRRDHDIYDLENIHGAIARNYEHRIAILEALTSKLQKQKNELETRRSLDLQGFHEDVSHLRKQLHTLHRKALVKER